MPIAKKAHRYGVVHLNTIILYHGSSYDFDVIDLKQGRPYKDFGQGFYASGNIDHAKPMAERNADREWARFITLNRNSKAVPHKFDIVIGPTANDFTNPTIQFYMQCQQLKEFLQSPST
jgi:hypothetical protein